MARSSRHALALSFTVAVLTPIGCIRPAAAQLRCSGDCNGDGTVTIDEPLTAVLIAQGRLHVERCRAADTNADAWVTIHELVAAVDSSLRGCDEIVPVHFGAERLAAGPSPASVLVLDFNADDHADIVVADRGSSELNVFLGTGDGRFTSGAPIELSWPGVAELKSEDLDLDGHPEIIIINRNGPIGIVPGGKTSLHGEPIYLDGAGTPTRVAFSDIDRDGRPDLVATNNPYADLSYFRQEGNLAFSSRRLLPADVLPADLAVGDFVEGGALEIVVAGSHSALLSIVDASDGEAIRDPISIPTVPEPVMLEVADFNHDGHEDIVVISREARVFATHLGNGNGGFDVRNGRVVSAEPADAWLSDRDGDGNSDLFVRSWQGVSYFRSHGNGEFDREQSVPRDEWPGDEPQADFDGNGSRDRVLLDPRVAVIFSDSDGQPARREVEMGDLRGPILAADLNGDGALDLVGKEGDVLVRTSDGFDGYEGLRRFPSDFRSLTAVDLDRDGRLDLVGRGGYGWSIGMLPGLGPPPGNGWFGHGRPVADVVYPFADSPSFVLDLDGNGSLDIVSAAQVGGLNVFALLQQGGEVFRSVVPPPVDSPAIPIAFGDLTGDGLGDLLAAWEDQAIVYPGIGDGTFGSGTYSTTHWELSNVRAPGSLSIDDFDGDGFRDVVVSGANLLMVLFGAGGGAFGETRLLDVSGYVPAVVADLNLDGRADIVAASHHAGDVMIHLNRGQRSFQLAQVVPSGCDPASLAIGDSKRFVNGTLIIGCWYGGARIVERVR